MTDKPRIIIGLLFVLVAVTFPFWYALAGQTSTETPELVLPESGQCIVGAAEMRAKHMDILEVWRNEVVRHGDQELVEVGDQKYEKSLTKTCMNCHESREAFCQKCHEYADVHPTCWNCHNEEKGD